MIDNHLQEHKETNIKASCSLVYMKFKVENKTFHVEVPEDVVFDSLWVGLETRTFRKESEGPELEPREVMAEVLKGVFEL